MPTLIQHLRSVVASETDDFFKDETLLYYLNKSQHRIVSYMANLESQRPDKSAMMPQGGAATIDKSLRALDGLRRVSSVAHTPSPTLITGNVYESIINLPTTVLQILSLRHGGYRTVKELPVTKLNHIFDGNYIPSSSELYYFIVDDTGTKKIRMFVPSTFSGSTEIFHIAKPTDMTVESTTVPSLPLQLENAVIYGAAEMALFQESFKGQNAAVQALQLVYQQELTSSLF
jgi:hypothetical protein